MKQHLLRRVERFMVEIVVTVIIIGYCTSLDIACMDMHIFGVSTNNQSFQCFYDKLMSERSKFHLVVFVDFLSMIYEYDDMLLVSSLDK